MIEVTRLNGIAMMVNSDLIKLAEESPGHDANADPGREADRSRKLR